MQNGYGYGLSDVGGGLSGAVDGVMLAKPAEPTPPLQSEVRNLERSIHRLDQMIATLAGRMEPVCRIEPPSNHVGTGGGVEARTRASSGLGGQLGAYADQIDSLSARVSGLLNRCEL